MGLLDFLLGVDSSSNKGHDHDRSVFDTDRFRNNGSSNWVDWEDVSTGRYEGDGFEHPNYDEDGEWQLCSPPTHDYTISEIKDLLGALYLDNRVEIVPNQHLRLRNVRNNH